MFSSLKLSNLRQRRASPGKAAGRPGPSRHPTALSGANTGHVVTTTRRAHGKWSLEKMCGEKEKKEEQKKKASEESVELTNMQADFSVPGNRQAEFQVSLECENVEEWTGGEVTSHLVMVTLQRINGSLGITLRGGAHPDPTLARALTITHLRPEGPAESVIGRQDVMPSLFSQAEIERMRLLREIFGMWRRVRAGMETTGPKKLTLGRSDHTTNLNFTTMHTTSTTNLSQLMEGTIKVGDRLLSVDGISLVGLGLSEAQKALQNGGEFVRLGVQYDVSEMSKVRGFGPLLVEVESPQPEKDILGLTLVDSPHGIVIGHISTASIAERCGALLPGDQILAVNSVRVEGSQLMAAQVAQLLTADQSNNLLEIEILPAHTETYHRSTSKAHHYNCPSPSLSAISAASYPYYNGAANCYNTQLTANMIKHVANTDGGGGGGAGQCGVFHMEATSVTLHAHNDSFGLVLGWVESAQEVVISDIEPGGAAHRSGCLQVGDRVLSINGIAPPQRETSLNELALAAAILSVQFRVAESVVPTSGMFTVKLAKTNTCSLGITITGCSHSGAMVISHIKAGSVAHRCGSLAPGDRILSVDSCTLEQRTLDQAMAILQNSGDIVTLFVHKEQPPPELLENIQIVELVRHDGGPLGITIAGSEDPIDPIIISALIPDGIAERSSLNVGDRLLAINSRSLGSATLSEAIALLQDSGDHVSLRIARVASENNNRGCYSSPGLPSVDSAVESWDSAFMEQTNFSTEREGSTVKRRHEGCDKMADCVIENTTQWNGNSQPSCNSLNTVLSEDGEDSCSSFHLSQNVLTELPTNGITPSPPCPLQASYRLRNNTLPHHRRRSSINDNPGLLYRFHDSIDSNLNVGRRNPSQQQQHVTFNTFKTSPSSAQDGVSNHPNNIFQVTLFKDLVYEDFGFSVSDGLYERGVYINRIRPGGPAHASQVLRPYDRIVQVNETRTHDLDCCLTVPLVASAGDRIQLTIARSHPTYYTDKDAMLLPWVEEEDNVSLALLQPSPTITKTL